MALLRELARPNNLPLHVFAHRAGKRTQQVYADLAVNPPRLLALTAGKRLRLPDWQLNPASLLLTQMLLRKGVDSWTIYMALSQPSEALGGRSPVEAVTPRNINEVATAVLDQLDQMDLH